MRRAARVDDNQSEIVAAFRKLGATVTPTHMIGQGFPDIVVGYKGINYLVEIKDDAKFPSERKLTSDEQKWHDKWGGRVDIVESIDDVVRLLNEVSG